MSILTEEETKEIKAWLAKRARARARRERLIDTVFSNFLVRVLILGLGWAFGWVIAKTKFLSEHF